MEAAEDRDGDDILRLGRPRRWEVSGAIRRLRWGHKINSP
jgi:hypothetical protein